MLRDYEVISPVWKADYQHHLQDLTRGRLRVASLLVVLIIVLVWVVYLGPVIIGEQAIAPDNSGFFINTFFLICSSAIAMTASSVTSRLRQQEFFTRQALKEEQAKSERLLLNILPAPIVSRLKDREEPISDSFDEVTILFADIVGFTPLSGRYSFYVKLSNLTA